MAYVRKYQMSFSDEHFKTPATWRIEIWPDEGVPATTPIILPAAETPLVLEYLNTDESKRSRIIGRRATIRYVYTGEAGVPLPNVFFDRDERFHQVRIYKNNLLDGTYYVKPDNSRRSYMAPPYEIELTAVDCLAYIKTQLFDVYENNLLKYEKISLFETLYTRAILKAIIYPVVLNVINTLRPDNLDESERFLHGISVHMDMFYDFIDGAVPIYEVLEDFCKSLYARFFFASGQAWFIRTPDLYQTSVKSDQYQPDGSGGIVAIPNFVKRIGPQIENAHGVPVEFNADIIGVPAVKKAVFDVNYKSINQLQNFDWSEFDGTDFAHWSRFNPAMVVQQKGAGTKEDPFRLFIPYPQPPSVIMYLEQYTDEDSVSQGDIVTVSFKYEWGNVTAFNIIIKAGDLSAGSGDYWTLDSSGNWKYTQGIEPGYISITRSGKKKTGSFDLKSVPIPYLINRPFPTGTVRIEIYPADDPPPINPGDPPLDPGEPFGVSVFLIKLGISPMGAEGRELTITNKANYSGEQDKDDFKFIDTGVATLSNTLFVGNEPAKDWKSSKDGILTRDIEQHMAQANIDGYGRSLDSFSSTIYSNSIEFYNVFSVDGIPDKKFMQLRDKYDVRPCRHDLLLEEIFPEQGAQTDYVEKDLEDSN